MGKGHARNEDTYLNKGGANEISAAQVKVAVDDLIDISLNIMLNAFRIAQIGSLTIFNMVKGFMDEYEDESGVDLVNSINAHYNYIEDFYTNFPSESIDSYTKLLLHLDNNVTDSEITPKTVTNNNVTFSDTIYKFGAYSAVFNGTNAYLTVPSSIDFEFGSNDFTIDGWLYLVDNVNQLILGQYQNGSNLAELMFTSGSGNLGIYYQTTLGVLAYYSTSTYTVPLNTWQHIEFVRNGTNFYIFVNGVSQSLTTYNAIGTNSLSGITSNLYIGQQGNGTYYLNGYLDEFRVSKGVARHTSNFTPPIMEYFIPGNLTLISNNQITTSIPIEARIVIFEEDIDSVTLNTDLKAYISRNNGSTYSQVILEDEGNYITGARILSGLVDISGQPSDTNIVYKLTTYNLKGLKIHGTAVSWK